MECNVGTLDRGIRAILAVFFAFLGLIFSPWWFILAVILLVTAFMGFCLPYTLFGINTCKKKTVAKPVVKNSKKKR